MVHAPADCEVVAQPDAGSGGATAAAAGPSTVKAEPAGAVHTPAQAAGKENKDEANEVKAEPAPSGSGGGGGGCVLKTPAATKRMVPLAGMPTPGATPSPFTPCAPVHWDLF